MSHTTVLKGINIVSIEAVERAVAELSSKGIKIALKKDAKPRAFYQNQNGMGKADYVIELGDSRYDIGLYRNDRGGYDLRTDFWAGDVEKVLGVKASSNDMVEQAKLGKLYQAYALNAAEIQAENEGYQYYRESGNNGVERLIVTL